MEGSALRQEQIKASFIHVGIVVPDLEAAMAEFTFSVGARWLPVQERPDGDATLRVTFSTTAPHIELIQGNPTGTWPTAEGPHLDHLAYWTDDYDAVVADLLAQGFEREAGGTSVWGGSWSYFRLPASGTRIELCDTRGRELFLQRWNFSD